MKHTILVTGGAGFIGSHVVDAYLAAGHRVIVIDNLSTGSRAIVKEHQRHDNYVFYQADICDAKKVRQIVQRERPDIINHQAAVVSVTQSSGNPTHTYTVNVFGTLTILFQGLAAGTSVKKVLFASTGGAMYARPKKFPAAETETPTPISPYGLSKQLAEEAVAFYCQQRGVPFTILRYANVFGPRQNPHGESGVMAIFSDLAARGKQPTIYRRQTTRDYVYVGDVARANLLALTKGANEIINIATGIETSNEQVFRAVAREFHWRQKPLYQPARPGELLRSVLSPKKAARVLGWRPTTSIAEGLQRIHAHLS